MFDKQIKLNDILYANEYFIYNYYPEKLNSDLIKNYFVLNRVIRLVW